MITTILFLSIITLILVLVTSLAVGNLNIKLLDIENALKSDITLIKKLSTNPNDYKYRIDPLVARDYMLMEDFDENGNVTSLINFLEYRESEKIVDLKSLHVPTLIDLMNKINHDVYVAEHGHCPDEEHVHSHEDGFDDEDFDIPSETIN